MFIKYHLVYYALFCLLLVICLLCNWVFVVLLLMYSIFIIYRLNLVTLIAMLVFSIAFVLTMHYPSPTSEKIIQGTIISKDDNSIVLQTETTKVKVYGEFIGFDYGDELEIGVEYFELSKPTNDNAFDYRRYLYSQGITNNASLTNIIKSQNNNSLLKQLLNRLDDDDLVDSYALMFVVGIREDLISDYYQQLTDLSVVHLFALSGLHIHMLKSLLKKPLSFLLPDYLIDYVCLLLIGFYLYQIPFNVSFSRAYLVMVLSTLGKKHLNRLDSLSIVTLLMIYLNPYVIFSLSFIFSYFLYFVIILINYHKYLNLLVYLGGLPIILNIQYRINILSLFLGIVLNPLVTILYQLLWLYVLFGSFFRPVVLLVIKGLHNIITFCSDFSIYLNFMKPNLFFILTFYFIYFKMIFKINIKQRIKHEVLLLLSLMLFFYWWPNGRIYGQVVMIDVGQGDCFLISQPFNQGNILIDTGGNQNYDLASNTIIPYLHSLGIYSLDYVFISHDDFDHSGAYDSLAKQIKIKNTVRDFEGTITIGQVLIERLDTGEYQDSNDNSLVFVATVANMKYLFTGDISSQVENELLNRYPSLQVDVLKVSHHGSKSATSGLFLASLQPKIALISCDKDNYYGHPSYEVIQRLNDYGVLVYRSDLMGMVKIVYYGNDNYVFINNTDDKVLLK